jgi:hypothetical protein
MKDTYVATQTVESYGPSHECLTIKDTVGFHRKPRLAFNASPHLPPLFALPYIFNQPLPYCSPIVLSESSYP